jgi:hypothetical protein
MRYWLVLALAIAAGALALGVNLALLGYAQPRNDPVGRLTPQRLARIEASISPGSKEPALSPEPRRHERISGRRQDD